MPTYATNIEAPTREGGEAKTTQKRDGHPASAGSPSWVKPKYGRPHRRVKAGVALVVQAGNALCVRCGRPIAADEPWDLGHVDGDPSRYAGAEHRACNRATNNRRGRLVSRLW